MFVIDFFKKLIMGRVTGAELLAKSKVSGAKARVAMKAAGGFNKAVDGSINKAKGSVKTAAPKPDGGKKKMGWFSKKDKGQTGRAAPQPVEEDVVEAKTQAINISAFEDARFKPCVGWVVVMDGPQEGRDFRLVAGRNRIGNNADMEVVLSDSYVSSHHATIVYNDEGIYQISDAGSTNGTRVNGKRVMQAQIVDNDRLQLGHTELKFKSLE